MAVKEGKLLYKEIRELRAILEHIEAFQRLETRIHLGFARDGLFVDGDRRNI